MIGRRSSAARWSGFRRSDGGMMMAARSTLVLAAAFVLCGAAFDSPSLYVPGVALAALVAGSRIWVELAARRARLEQLRGPWSIVEGEPYGLGIRIHSGRLPLPGGRVVHPLADRPLPVGMHPGRHARLELRSPRRGRRRLEPATLLLSDPMGLRTAEIRSDARRGGLGPATDRAGRQMRGAGRTRRRRPRRLRWARRHRARHQGDRLRDRRVAPLPQWQPRLAHPLGDRGTDRRDGGAPAGGRRRFVAARGAGQMQSGAIRTRSTPRFAPRPRSAFTWRRPAGARCWSPVSAGGWRSTRSSGRGPRSTPTWPWSRPAAPRPRFSACRRPRRSSG